MVRRLLSVSKDAAGAVEVSEDASSNVDITTSFAFGMNQRFYLEVAAEQGVDIKIFSGKVTYTAGMEFGMNQTWTRSSSKTLTAGSSASFGNAAGQFVQFSVNDVYRDAAFDFSGLFHIKARRNGKTLPKEDAAAIFRATSPGYDSVKPAPGALDYIIVQFSGNGLGDFIETQSFLQTKAEFCGIDSKNPLGTKPSDPFCKIK